MLKTIDSNIAINNKQECLSKFRDELLQDYYHDYINSLSSHQLDKEFNRDLSLLVKSLKKISPDEQGAFINSISKLIEFYIENKIEKELNKSFKILLKF